MSTVKVSPMFLNEQFIPSLEEVTQERMPGKLAYAVSKNLRAAQRAFVKFMKKRSDIISDYLSPVDGKFPTKTEEDGREVLDFPVEEDRATFEARVEKVYKEADIELDVHMVSEELFSEVTSVRPVTMLMLQVMIETDVTLQAEDTDTNTTDDDEQSSQPA